EKQETQMDNPHCDTGGRWRYVPLQPGQTVFFRPGTIHCVVRARDRQTSAFGGYALR
ncbi:hypothetical protein BT67DRAFT_376913, partial [Trichocladium antarcticum]